MSAPDPEELKRIAESFGVAIAAPDSRGRLVIEAPKPLDANTMARLRYSLRCPFEVRQTEAGRPNTKRPNPRRPTSSSRETFVAASVDRLIRSAADAGASDLHIEPLQRGVRVRVRVNGLCRELETLPSSVAPIVGAQIKALSQLDMAERRLPQDGRVMFQHGDRAFDLRVSVFPSSHGEAFVLRFMNQGLDEGGNTSEGLKALSLPAACLSELEEATGASDGLVLLTGATGSGKTTTLYAALSELRSPERKIVTVEDPIEQRFEEITQIGVQARRGLDFARVLRHILRHDPDVVLIGEIRDRETATIAMRAALTGHKVFSTLHARDAIASVSRLLGLGIEPELIAASLTHAFAQRLLRRLCHACAQPQKIGDGGRRYFEMVGINCAADSELRRASPEGCPNCQHSGISHRQPILETFRLSSASKGLIARRATGQKLRATAASEGYAPLARRAAELCQAGQIALSEWLRCCPPSHEGSAEEDSRAQR